MQTEVETAVRERLPIMTILLNNSRMGGYDHHMPAASARFGSNRLSGHYAGVAAELGAYSERVEDAADVAAAIGRGIAATRGAPGRAGDDHQGGAGLPRRRSGPRRCRGMGGRAGLARPPVRHGGGPTAAVRRLRRTLKSAVVGGVRPVTLHGRRTRSL